MNKWPLVALGEICAQHTGSRTPTNESDIQFRYTDIASVDNRRKSITEPKLLLGKDAPSRARRVIKEGDVIVSMTRPSLNAVALVPPDLDGEICSTGFCVLRHRDNVLPEYIFNFVQSKIFIDEISAAVSGAMYPAVTEKQIKNVRLPLPPLAEQRRIVDILNRANGILRLRRQAQEKARQLIPALFVKMFGDPGAVHRQESFGALVEEFRYGTSRKASDAGAPVLRIPNVIGGKIDVAELKTVALEKMEFQRLKLKPGDLLFVRTNGNPNYVGRCAVFSHDAVRPSGFPPDAFAFASYLIRARLKPKSVDPTFLQAFFQGDLGRRSLLEHSRTSAGQYNINTESLRSISIPLPPLDLQQAFANRVADIQSIIEEQDRMTAASGRLVNSLMHQVFEEA